MKTRYLLFLFIICGLCLIVNAQVLNQDSEGESSIIYPGALVYFNVTESQVGFSYNNLPRTIVKKQGLLLSGTLKGESKTGTLDFLKKGDFVPSSKISGVIGFYKNYHQRNSKLEILSNTGNIRKYTLKMRDELRSKFDGIINASTISSTDQARLIDTFKKLTEDLDFPKTVAEMEDNFRKDYSITFSVETDGTIKSELGSLSPLSGVKGSTDSEADKIISNNYKLVEDAKKDLETNRMKIKKERQKNILGFSLYFAGGLEVTGYDFIDTTKFQSLPFESISDESFSQGEFLFGSNINIGGSWVIGLALGSKRVSNFQSLSKKEFLLQEVISSSSGGTPDTTVLVSKKDEQSVYDAKPTLANHFILKADVVYYYPTENGNIALNAYLRYQSPSDSEEIFASVTDLGIGAYFNNSKGKFQGGVYFQFNDISDNRSKLRMDNSNLNFGERLSFGLITKFPIGSVFQRLDTAK